MLGARGELPCNTKPPTHVPRWSGGTSSTSQGGGSSRSREALVADFMAHQRGIGIFPTSSGSIPTEPDTGAERVEREIELMALGSALGLQVLEESTDSYDFS